MNNVATTCPDEGLLHAWVDDRDETLPAPDRAEIRSHVSGCAACEAQVTDLRRFRTLVLRTRVPGLDADQWRNLDTRIEMMATEPGRRGPRGVSRVYWGVAIAAAASIFAVGAWQLFQGRGDGPMTALSAIGQARVAGAFTPVQIAVAEGSLEFAGADGHFHPVLAGEKLTRGGQLRSLTASRLVVANNFEARMSAGSAVTVLAGNEREVFLRLRHGEIACRVDKRRHGQRFGVLAGRFRTRVLGTEFTVRHDRQGRVAVEVSEGAVRVDEADDPWRSVSETTSVVRAGNRWRFTGGRMELGPIVQPSAGSAAAAAAATPSAGSTAPAGAAGTTSALTSETPSSATALTGRSLPRPVRRAPRDAAKRGHRDLLHTSAGKQAAASGPILPPLPIDALPPAPQDRATMEHGAATGRGAGRRILINVPPQAMSPEEVRRAKATERGR